MIKIYHNLKNYYYQIKGVLGLSFSLAWADFKLRNEGSYLGIFWYLLNPLVLFLIILFLRKAVLYTGFIKLYPLYLFLGVIMNNFFSSNLSSSVDTIDNNSSVIKSIKINYHALVVSKILQSTFSHFFEVLLLAAFMIYFNVPLIGIIYYLVIFVLFFVFLLGASFAFTVIGVYINDFGNIWSIVVQLIFFATPTFYSLQRGTLLYKVNLINPLYYFLTAARDVSIYNKLPDFYLIAGIALFSTSFFVIGIIIFNKFKSKFAELV